MMVLNSVHICSFVNVRVISLVSRKAFIYSHCMLTQTFTNKLSQRVIKCRLSQRRFSPFVVENLDTRTGGLLLLPLAPQLCFRAALWGNVFMFPLTQQFATSIFENQKRFIFFTFSTSVVTQETLTHSTP